MRGDVWATGSNQFSNTPPNMLVGMYLLGFINIVELGHTRARSCKESHGLYGVSFL